MGGEPSGVKISPPPAPLAAQSALGSLLLTDPVPLPAAAAEAAGTHGAEAAARPSHAEAEGWLRCAAEQGSAEARLQLAALYLRRRDARQLTQLATRWLRSARILSSKTSVRSLLQLGGALSVVPATLCAVFALPFPA